MVSTSSDTTESIHIYIDTLVKISILLVFRVEREWKFTKFDAYALCFSYVLSLITYKLRKMNMQKMSNVLCENEKEIFIDKIQSSSKQTLMRSRCSLFRHILCVVRVFVFDIFFFSFVTMSWLHTNFRLMFKRDKWLLNIYIHKCHHSFSYNSWLCGQRKRTNKIGSICAYNNKRCTQRTWLMYLCDRRNKKKIPRQQFVVLEFKMILKETNEWFHHNFHRIQQL